MPAKKTTTKSAAVKKAVPAKKSATATTPLKKGNIKPLRPTS